MKNQTAAIICAYNEQDTIIGMLKNISGISLFDEVIIVNDGSTDKTGQHIKKAKKHLPIKDIHLGHNMGKGYAMAVGAKHTHSEFLVFIDADLSNFTATHAEQLLKPLLNGEADMVLGQATETLIHHSINPFTSFAGQRALRKKDLFPIIDRMKPARFGVETLLNMHFKADQKVVKQVCLDKLVHPTKFKKTKPHLAIGEFVAEGYQILRTALLNLDLLARHIKNRIPIELSMLI